MCAAAACAMLSMLLAELGTSLSQCFLHGQAKEIWCHFAVVFFQVSKLARNNTYRASIKRVGAYGLPSFRCVWENKII